MNLTIFSILQSGKYFHSPFISRNYKQLSFDKTRFYKFSHELLSSSFFKKTSLLSISQSNFLKFLSPVLTLNKEECIIDSETLNEPLNFENQSEITSVKIHKCIFKDIGSSAIVLANQKLQILSSTFQNCFNSTLSSCLLLGSQAVFINLTLFDSNNPTRNLISTPFDSITFELYNSNFTNNKASLSNAEKGKIIEFESSVFSVKGCIFNQPAGIQTDCTLYIMSGQNTIHSTIFYLNTLPIINQVTSNLNLTICIFSKTQTNYYSVQTSSLIYIHQCCFDRNYSAEISNLNLVVISQSIDDTECKLTATPYWVTDDSITKIRRELTYIVYYSIFGAIVILTVGMILIYTKKFLKKIRGNDEEPLTSTVS